MSSSNKRQQKKREQLRRVKASRTNPDEQPRPPRLNKMLQEAGREAEQIAAKLLKRSDRAELVEQIANSTRTLALKVIRSSPMDGKHACQAGCSFCCHTAVTVAPPEAFAIAAYLQDHCSSAERDKLRLRLDCNAELASSMPRNEYIASLIPCGLMTEDGNCMAHPVRPLACAGFLSTSRQKCEAEFKREPDRAAVPIDKFASAAGLCVAIGTQNACNGAGLDGTAIELHHALRRIMDTPDAAARWASGEEVFQDCLR